MLEVYKDLKLKYNDYLILFKSGSFYVSFDCDATVLNKLFNYKLVKLKSNIKAGFPITLFNRNINLIEKNKINYIVVENKKIKDRKKYKYNNYSKYSNNDIFKLVSINSRINNISNKLMN